MDEYKKALINILVFSWLNRKSRIYSDATHAFADMAIRGTPALRDFDVERLRDLVQNAYDNEIDEDECFQRDMGGQDFDLADWDCDDTDSDDYKMFDKAFRAWVTRTSDKVPDYVQMCRL